MPADTERLSAALADRYAIEHALGQGGMATVYLARDLKHDRGVAIKVLKPELAAVLGAERFVVEIKTTAALQHPHILPLFDSGTADGFLYYVMPYVEGETIRQKLNRETQFGIDDSVRIAREVADALDYAHRHGVIHRDIKPENVLLHDGRAMVMDFGIALAVSAAAGGRMTETGLSLGTPHYMSPEQATADKDITPRSDIYSLGTVLYEMLAGEPPHVGGSAQAVIMKIIADEARPVQELRRSVPPNVAAAVARAIEKVPADRFENAKAFADALANPAFTTVMAARGNAPRAAGVSPALFWSAAAIALVSLAGAAWSWRRPTPPHAVTRVSMGFPDNQRLTDLASFFRVSLSPDGRTLVYVGAGTTLSASRLWIRHLDELTATPLAGTDGAINPSFSPDGRRLAFVSSNDMALRVVAVSGGATTVLVDSLVDRGGVSWGTDGYIYYDGHLPGDGLARVPETGGKAEAATSSDSTSERFHMNPSALPNARGVLFTIARPSGLPTYDIGVLDSRTGKYKVLVRGAIGRYAESGHLIYVTADGTMMAAPFDLEHLRITGEAFSLAQGVAVRALSRGDVSISASGTMVYAAGSTGGGLGDLAWVTRDGKITPVDSQFARYFIGPLHLSPDGRQAAVTTLDLDAQRSVWVKQLDHGPATRVMNAGSPAWSPDGKTLIATTNSKLALGPADGSSPPREIDVGHVAPATPVVSPDGKWFIYIQQGAIYARSAVPGDSATKLLVSGLHQSAPAISPDGRWLAYSSDESGREEIYVRPLPDAKASKQQVSVAGGISPHWSRTGRELYFVDESRHMVAVPVTPGPTFIAGEPKQLFDVSMGYTPTSGVPFDIAADGRFLVARVPGIGSGTRDEVILVENLFDDLKAKTKR
ncbi:MAG TPA: protein kinase [Gemmatimonadaceae bacterium]|nr:protein kinase [Gemmatimonadaceae bacterium]